ncbi:MAG: TRAP transporter large permease subunit [Dehalococcoidia bacterium]|nr:TRAP transporter large permease subunit [Dehalococcoidia bacterium]
MDRILNIVLRWLSWVAAGVLTALMFFTTADVCLRYIFNKPIVGGLEVSEYLMAALVSLCLAHTAFKRGHIGVDLLVSRLSEKAQATINSITCFLGLILALLMTWQTILYARDMQERQQASATLGIPAFPFVWIVAIASLILALVLLSNLLQHLSRLIKSRATARRGFVALGFVVVLLFVTAPLWAQAMHLQLAASSVGYVGMGLMFLLLASSMSIGFVMSSIGFLGMMYLVNTDAGLSLLGRVPYATMADYSLMVLPLFILMGELAFQARLSEDLYFMVHKWVGHLRGGLAMATIGACAGFAAVCGSSVATAATMTTVALPEMRRHKYDPALSTGTLAAGGTLGILIPPSIGFIIYAMTTSQSIGKLFIAGIFPGIILTILYMLTVYIIATRNPKTAPPAPRASFTERLTSLKNSWGVLLLFLVVMGGMYMGVFTPTEAAGIGAFGAFLYALVMRRLTLHNYVTALLDAMQITGMMFLIIIGTYIFGYFLAATRLPSILSEFVANLPVARLYVLLGILVLYLILGCLMEIVAMILLTMPIIFPAVILLGYDPIWFGVIIVIMMEMGLITPPVGLNVFVIAGMAKDIPMVTIFRGVAPFVGAQALCIAILIAFPQIATFLPTLMIGK